MNSCRSTEQCTYASQSHAPAVTKGVSLQPRATCCSFHSRAVLVSQGRCRTAEEQLGNSAADATRSACKLVTPRALTFSSASQFKPLHYHQRKAFPAASYTALFVTRLHSLNPTSTRCHSPHFCMAICIHILRGVILTSN